MAARAILRGGAVVVGVLAVCLYGCVQSSLDQILGGGPVEFKSPAGKFIANDSQTVPVRYTVTIDHSVKARLEIDRDQTAGNGNETILASEQTIDAPGGEASFDLNAGSLPYGTYYLRVVLSDEAGAEGYSPRGPLNIVPLVDNGDDDNNAGMAMLSQVEGMRMLHTTGQPGKVNSRVPFVATWSNVDVRDQLSPIYIAPVQVDKPITIQRMQFYVYSHHPEEHAKQLQIYSGASENSTGNLIADLSFSMTSSAGGGWNMVTIDPPITLAPGQYGVSFHGEEECEENWAANTGSGPGYALMSPLQGMPYQTVTSDDLGFSPNFSIRMLGSLDKDPASAIAGSGPNDQPVIPIDPGGTPSQPDTYPTDGDKPAKTGCDEGEDELRGTTPFHVAWQVIP